MSQIRTALLTLFSILLLAAASAKTCTKEQFHTYMTYKMNPATQQLYSALQFRKSIIIACCDGYREISRYRVPTCKPICAQPCGNGFCSGPNTCACYEGFAHSSDGVCRALEDSDEEPQTTTPTTVTPTTVTPTTVTPTTTTPTTTTSRRTTSTTTTTKPPTTATTRMITTLTLPPAIKKSNIFLSSLKANPIHLSTWPQPPPTPMTTRRPPRTTERRSWRCGACSNGRCFGGECFCLSGYRAADDGNCHPVCSAACLNGECVAPNHCKCLEGYAYDHESGHCKPTCNGKIYGCVRGTCVGFNQCRCEDGTALGLDERFHCYAPAEPTASPLWYREYRWYLLLLLVPLAVVICVSCHIVVRRWKLAKANRLEAQVEDLPEVRYYNATNDHSVNGKHRKPDDGTADPTEPIYTNSTLRRMGNVVVINT